MQPLSSMANARPFLSRGRMLQPRQRQRRTLKKALKRHPSVQCISLHKRAAQAQLEQYGAAMLAGSVPRDVQGMPHPCGE